MARIEELINEPRRCNRVASVKVDGLTLIAERVNIDNQASEWKLTKIDRKGQPVANDPPFADSYTKEEILRIAEFEGCEEWKPLPIDHKQGLNVVDGKSYEERTPRY